MLFNWIRFNIELPAQKRECIDSPNDDDRELNKELCILYIIILHAKLKKVKFINCSTILKFCSKIVLFFEKKLIYTTNKTCHVQHSLSYFVNNLATRDQYINVEDQASFQCFYQQPEKYIYIYKK